jgi:hypothetical protein
MPFEDVRCGARPGTQNPKRPVVDSPAAAALDRDGDIPSRHRLIENQPPGPRAAVLLSWVRRLAGAATCCPFLVHTTNIE